MMDQMQLFTTPEEDAAARKAARTAHIHSLWAVFEQMRVVRPDTQEVPPEGEWCGRCGADIQPYDLVINHDLGYLGCPADLDPTWREYPIHGFRCAEGYGQGILKIVDLCDRWDRQFFTDCVCGHPWGVHNRNVACGAHCGCGEYQAATHG